MVKGHLTKRRKRRLWSNEDIKYLKENYSTATYSKIANHLKRHTNCVINKAIELKLKKNKKWAPKEINYLKRNFLSKTVKELAKELEIPITKIRGTLGRNKISYTRKEKRMGRTKRLLQRKHKYDKDDINGYFITGLIAGEGCFSIKKDNKSGFQFEIGLAEDDKDTLYFIQKTIGCGRIYSNDYSARNFGHQVYYKLSVSKFDDLISKIIPFIETYGLCNTKKERQFEEWKKKFMKYLNGKLP